MQLVVLRKAKTTSKVEADQRLYTDTIFLKQETNDA